MESQRSSAYAPRERPGCVTAYAILLGLAAGLIGLGGIIGGFALMSVKESTGIIGMGVLVCASGMAFLEAMLAVGLWQLKNWARITVMVLIGLGMLSSLLSLCTLLSGYSSYGNNSGAFSAGSAAGTIVGLAINGFVLYWFANNGEYFK